MEEAIAGFPFIFGLLASIIHVISGPDHLAAVSPIALRAPRRAWMIGFSWGIGHLAGMLLIGLLFFFFRDLFPIELISDNSEKIVGFMLIAIGIWAWVKLIPKHGKHTHDHAHVDESGDAFVHRHEHHHKHQHTLDEAERQSWFAALGIGILHGLAGVSHIVSLLPTLAFETNSEAVFYLIGFGAGTIVAMVAFAFVMGLISRSASHDHKHRLLTYINGIAGLAAIVVGTFWIINTW